MNAPVTEMTGDTTLMIRRTFKADLATLWTALTDPAAWLHWFGGGHATPESATADLRPGGAWKLDLRGNDSGNRFSVAGEFVTVEPKTRVSFTWAWSFGDGAASRVTYILSPDSNDRTTLTLTHERFENADTRDQHGRGWNASLEQLDDYLAREGG